MGGGMVGNMVVPGLGGIVGGISGRAHELAKMKSKITGKKISMREVAGDAAVGHLRGLGRGITEAVGGAGLGAVAGAGLGAVAGAGLGALAHNAQAGAAAGALVGGITGAIHGPWRSSHNSTRDYAKEYAGK